MRSVDILIIGTGFGGIGMAIRLAQAGFHDCLLLERASALGGTWRDNHYPGAACDVESHLYSFSFEPNADWSHVFARQPEIRAYMERCADKYGIRSKMRFDSNVVHAAFDEASGRWAVRTENGDQYSARVLVSACGGLSNPSKPDIPGLAHFRGKLFHSSRWDASYDLDGKRVAVIGTGASAIQIVPEIAPRVARLDVYQRTAPWVIPRQDRPIGRAEKALYRRAPAVQRLARTAIFWKRELFGIGFFKDPRVNQLGQRLALRNIARGVEDRELRRKLVPNYVMGCKRVLLSNDYYPALARPNVELVTDPIADVRADSIVTRDGRRRAIDALVLATGFEAAEQLAPFEVLGRGGRSLDDAWRGGSEAYRGTTVAGFPNAFLIVGPNTGLGHGSMITMIEAQIEYIVGALEHMRARNVKLLEVKAEDQRAYNAAIHARLERTVWATGGCVSWYRTRSGKNTTLWPGFMVEFQRQMKTFDPRAYDAA
ncbi:MAG: NAD(P)/FAD-dependent oxidoreductase [Polyangiaceae bacterium]